MAALTLETVTCLFSILAMIGPAGCPKGIGHDQLAEDALPLSPGRPSPPRGMKDAVLDLRAAVSAPPRPKLPDQFVEPPVISSIPPR
jgi:hypothetical protein